MNGCCGCGWDIVHEVSIEGVMTFSFSYKARSVASHDCCDLAAGYSLMVFTIHNEIIDVRVQDLPEDPFLIVTLTRSNCEVDFFFSSEWQRRAMNNECPSASSSSLSPASI